MISISYIMGLPLCVYCIWKCREIVKEEKEFRKKRQEYFSQLSEEEQELLMFDNSF